MDIGEPGRAGERVGTDSCNYEIRMRRGQKHVSHESLNAWPMDFAMVV